MQFEDFDNKVREAAGLHHPNYDEKAWTKMERLLDKHLPLKDDRRRRIIFFLLFLFLLGGGLWMFINKPWQQDRQVSFRDSNILPKSKSVVSADSFQNESGETPHNNSPLNDEQDRSSTVAGTEIKDPIMENSKTGSFAGDINSLKKGISAKPKDSQKPGMGVEVQASPGTSVKKNKIANDVIKDDNVKKEIASSQNNTVGVPPVTNRSNNAVSADKSINQPGLGVANEIISRQTDLSKKDTQVAEQPVETKKKTTAKKSRSKKTNSLFFSLSAGPDISYVGLDNPGKVKLLTGAGLGYTIKDRWTIRTGFYSVSKIYSAAPADYKPTTPLINTSYLKDISANCKVYEIPLSIAYNFGRSEKHKTFASLGLSSLIMKKEEYKYKYLYPGTPPIYYTHSEKNKYKHYFSTLALSGGYQRRINKTFSIMAEPYLKIPLAGVGYGKVKLAGAGILFSVGMKLF